MATKFTKGQQVKINAVLPQGPVAALRMDEEGNFFYQISWVGVDGVEHTRWFCEEELVAA